MVSPTFTARNGYVPGHEGDPLYAIASPAGTPLSASTSNNPASGPGYTPVAGSDYRIADIQAAQAIQVQQIIAQADKYRTDQNTQLNLQLTQQKITADQYAAQKLMMEQQVEFAQTQALNQLKEQHNYEIQSMQNQINQEAEVRQERELSAKLAANPQDWVAYEFYKRSGGTPQQTLGAPGSPSGAATPASGGLNGTGNGLSGTAYPAAPPAYSDSTIQGVASSLFGANGANGQGALYNPNLSGTGAFGMAIPGPQDLSRSTYGALSDSEKAMLTGSLQAGVNMDGKQVSIDPIDYFSQAMKSWVPTLSSAAPQSQYSA